MTTAKQPPKAASAALPTSTATTKSNSVANAAAPIAPAATKESDPTKQSFAFDALMTKAYTPDGQQCVAEPQAAIDAKSAAEIYERLVSGDHFKENVLNSFHLPSYHWRLFSTADQEFITKFDGPTGAPQSVKDALDRLDNMEQVTIAETAMTTYNIDEVTMSQVVSPDFQTRTSSYTDITVNITEPNGVSFLDSLVLAASNIRSRNYLKSWYYLELTFNGYEGESGDEGAISTNPLGSLGLNNGGRWIWQVVIKDIEVNLTAGGGTYVLKMIPSDLTALDQEYRSVPEMRTCAGGTIGAMLDSLATNLNESWKFRMANPVGDIVKFDFKVHPIPGKHTADEVRAMKLAPDREGFNPTRSLGFTIDDGIPTAHLPRGQSIPDLITEIMSSSEEAQKLAKDSKADPGKVDDSDTKVNDKGFREGYTWRSDTETRLVNYDPITQTYYRHITYHIFGHYNQAPILSMTQVKNAADTSVQKEMIKSMASKGFLPKRYDYLFTGLNTEIIDLDLKFNMAWSAAMPRLVNYTNDQSTTHGLYNSEQVKDKNAQDAMTQYRALYDKRNSDAEAIVNLKAQEQQTPLSAEDQQKLADLVKAVADADKALVKMAEEVEVDRRRQQGNDKTDYFNAKGIVHFAEELDHEVNPLPVSMSLNNDEARNETGEAMVGQYHPGKAIYGAIMNQLHGPMTTQFQSITMQVRGDPYWLGPATFDSVVMNRKPVQPDEYRADYRNGTNNFLLSYRYPLKMTEDGEPIIATNEVVTGIYGVRRVEHRFSNGQFTQSLEATRVALIDVFKALGYKKIGKVNSDGSMTVA